MLKKAKVVLLLNNFGELGVILHRFGAEDVYVTVDDENVQSEYFDNGDALSLNLDDILGYELR